MMPLHLLKLPNVEIRIVSESMVIRAKENQVAEISALLVRLVRIEARTSRLGGFDVTDFCHCNSILFNQPDRA